MSGFSDLPQKEKFHAPLQPGDTVVKTIGCRHSTPGNCAKHSLMNVCAFVREDGICVSPPKSWKKQFAKLSADTPE